ncbi:MAG: glycogen debranching enzyme N-terminal domain-containing protein [Kiritimatiellae bacterium]|nr:glycogen debranching enzyme N-terminal domain-containing protein [Kiritimatiellia bacterium]
MGDIFNINLKLDNPVKGLAVFRSNLGKAHIKREEIIASTQSGDPVLACDWHDIPMVEKNPGEYILRVPLLEVGVFSGKTCFFEEGSSVPQWPEGDNMTIKVEPAHTACANSMYSAFVRQFGEALHCNPDNDEVRGSVDHLDQRGYTVIPPSGKFRDLMRQLDMIMGAEGFRILQLLPVHPVPTTYARMGRYGSAFAALDFFSVDPSLAEFDKSATPLDQFGELITAVHSRGGYLYMDLPANHTGWAATMQIHHPEWYGRNGKNEFASPGAWGVVWADLVELDYKDPQLCSYMAEVFLFWCRQGVDGFRCDAGYMIPSETWTFIIARVREEYPDTVFLLEGLGGKVETTEKLLSVSNMNWAYSELFQTMDRGAMEWYLPRSIEMAERCGPLVHFAETHDNARLAAGGEVFARNRTMLSAMLAHQGAFGMANGVEWYATERIDVHGAAALNWGAENNQVHLIARMNKILELHPAFGTDTALRMVSCNSGPFFAVWRSIKGNGYGVLVLVNLDCENSHLLKWKGNYLNKSHAWDLISGEELDLHSHPETTLQPGAVLALTAEKAELDLLEQGSLTMREPPRLTLRRRNAMAMRVVIAMKIRYSGINESEIHFEEEPDEVGLQMVETPDSFCVSKKGGLPHQVKWQWPHDIKRHVMIPDGDHLLVRAPYPFDLILRSGEVTHIAERAIPFADGDWGAFIPIMPYDDSLDGSRAEQRQLTTTVYREDGVQTDTSTLLILPPADRLRINTRCSGNQVRADSSIYAVLSNGAGAMAQVRAAWGTLFSQYDGMLITNNDPHVPVDKMVFWRRSRCWLRYCGYSQEINIDCLESFEADPGGRFAEWHFVVPCGMGKSADITFRLEMALGVNRVQLMVRRNEDGDYGLDAADEISIILRPDIEWRSFHTQTKAFQGAEDKWPAAIEAFETGFNFRPAEGECCTMESASGHFYHEPEWSYMVAHPLEAERGLEASGDLFSPGWFELALLEGESAVITAKRDDHWGEDIDRNKDIDQKIDKSGISVPTVLSRSMDIYVVRRDALRTVIAGYPWFLDWGRDTLIVLRGLIADGRTAESLTILKEFGRFEKRGTIPNMIRGTDDANRETSDALLWFCVAAGDLINELGVEEVLNTDCVGRPLSQVLESIVANIKDGTPNGITMDQNSALIYSPPHYTWMDTNYPAATPREGYPVEIQALWIAALRLVAKHVDSKWDKLADKAQKSLKKYFVHSEGWLVDCLRAKSGVSAANAIQEDAVRCNQLLAVTLGVLDDDPELEVAVIRSCEPLLVPGAIRSLDDRRIEADMTIYGDDGAVLNDSHYPYKGHYLGDEDTLRKPAYHNGTAWSWPFPLYAEAMYKVYGDEARERGLSLLGSAIEYLNTGCLGHLPEITDGDAPHAARGCGAQAWGVSELLRVWHLLDGHGASAR